MTPYYQDDAVTIYHGDCRDVLPSMEQCGAIITDPPYGTRLYDSDLPVVDAELMSLLCGLSPAIALFGWPEQLVDLCVLIGRTPTEWVTWWPTNARQGRGFTRKGLWREVECIAAFGDWQWGRLRQPAAKLVTAKTSNPAVRGKPHPDGSRVGDVWTDESPNLNMNQPGRLHPNEKPLGVMLRLVTACDGPVVDPFMGSGTTLRAAKDLGRKAIGIEIEERYCEIAARRMAQEVLPL